jgi:hypothetical protein
VLKIQPDSSIFREFEQPGAFSLPTFFLSGAAQWLSELLVCEGCQSFGAEWSLKLLVRQVAIMCASSASGEGAHIRLETISAWQHRLLTKRPICTKRKSLLESADGAIATGLTPTGLLVMRLHSKAESLIHQSSYVLLGAFALGSKL